MDDRRCELLPRAGRAPAISASQYGDRVASLLLSRRDLDFLLYEWLEVAALTERERFADHSRGTFDAVLDLAEHVATNDFAPHNKLSDAREPRVVDGKVE